MDITTIRIQRDILTEFRKLKIHPRETDEDIIRRVIKGELNPSPLEGDASIKETTLNEAVEHISKKGGAFKGQGDGRVKWE